MHLGAGTRLQHRQRCRMSTTTMLTTTAWLSQRWFRPPMQAYDDARVELGVDVEDDDHPGLVVDTTQMRVGEMGTGSSR